MFVTTGVVGAWLVVAALGGWIRATADTLTVRSRFRTRVYERRDMADALLVQLHCQRRAAPQASGTAPGSSSVTIVTRAHDGTCLCRLPIEPLSGGSPTDVLVAMGVPIATEVVDWSPADLERNVPRSTWWIERHPVWLAVVVTAAMVALALAALVALPSGF